METTIGFLSQSSGLWLAGDEGMEKKMETTGIIGAI